MTTAADKKAAATAIAKALARRDELMRMERLKYFTPYQKQLDFFAQGQQFRERLFSAGNQLGKTEAGAFEMACHLTGYYPDWWVGIRFDHPIQAFACGYRTADVRDGPQKKLLGEPGLPEMLGTGYIPKSAIVGAPSSLRGTTDSVDTVHVRHKSGGISVLRFKSYQQGREAFQGVTLDVIWLDEEPDIKDSEAVYNECLARTREKRGYIFVTFTPHKGITSIYNRFTGDNDGTRGFTVMTIRDKPGLTEEQIQEDVARYSPHERDTRLYGIPSMGKGRIFLIPEDVVTEPPIDHIPLHWYKLWGCDFGINHPFAAVLACWDKDDDVIHVTHTVRMPDAIPVVHATSMKAIAANVPVCWPQDGTKRESGGETVASQYRKAGLRMLENHSTFSEGGISTEAGILEMRSRFETGKLKIARTLSDLIEEYRMYHRDDYGMIAKVNDDLLSALRQIIMMKRYAAQGPIGNKRAARMKPGQMAEHAELSYKDLWGGGG